MNENLIKRDEKFLKNTNENNQENKKEVKLKNKKLAKK